MSAWQYCRLKWHSIYLSKSVQRLLSSFLEKGGDTHTHVTHRQQAEASGLATAPAPAGSR
jgi:hypothetical protein